MNFYPLTNQGFARCLSLSFSWLKEDCLFIAIEIVGILFQLAITELFASHLKYRLYLNILKKCFKYRFLHLEFSLNRLLVFDSIQL